MQAVPINDDIGFLPLCSPPVYYAEMLIVAHRVAPFLAARKYYSKGVGTVKSYAQNSLQAAERSVVMQWRDR